MSTKKATINSTMRNSDERVMSRHLTSHESTSFRRNITSASSAEHFGSSNLDSLHPTRISMGNLAGNLRRSMPSVNAQQQPQSKQETNDDLSHGYQMHGGGETIRHMSLCINKDDQKRDESVREDSVGSQNRCTSANSHYPSVNHSVELGKAIMVGSNNTDDTNNTSILDTQQIQVYLKKREDSLATITTMLSNITDIDSNADDIQHKKIASKICMPLPPPLNQNISGGFTHTCSSSAPIKNPRKKFMSSETRSSIFSVSSSLDSTKEERIISNWEHTSVANNRVVVLPRPHSLIPSHSIQMEQGCVNVDEENKIGYDRVRSNSVEYQRDISISPLLQLQLNGDRRPSILSTSNSDLPLHTSWHSVAELNTARQLNDVDGTIGQKVQNLTETMIETQIPHLSSPPRPQSQASNKRSSNYLGELVWQVDETVYCGGIEAAQNQNLLCRLNIEYIVDLSGQEDDPTLANSRPHTEYPCLCSRRTAHSRMIMSIRVKDDSHHNLLQRDVRPSSVDAKAQLMEREEIIHYFEALIDLIRKARISQKKVLIHSLKGRNRAPAFVSAYLMHCNRVTRVQAINKITNMMNSIRPGIYISDTLQRALMRWQSILGIRAECSRFDSQQLTKMFSVKKTAWN